MVVRRYLLRARTAEIDLACFFRGDLRFFGRKRRRAAPPQARSVCGKRAAPAKGAQRLLRAPKARVRLAERRRRECVRSPAWVKLCFYGRVYGGPKIFRGKKAARSAAAGAQRLLQARSACCRRAAPAAGAQRLLRAPKARALRGERRRRERVRSPAWGIGGT
jgi:hypothetical protein